MVKMGRDGEGVEAEGIGSGGKIDMMVMLIGRVRKEKFFLLLKAMQPIFEKTLKGEVQVGRAEIIKVGTWI